MTKKTQCLFLFFVIVSYCQCSSAVEVYKNAFDAPFIPEDSYGEIAYYFTSNFDDDTVITNQIAGGRLTQTVNPYTVTNDQSPDAYAHVEHLKVVQYVTASFEPNGHNKRLRMTGVISVTNFGMLENPFPPELVTNYDDDIRLGACGISAVNFDVFIVANFLATNEGLWIYYERSPLGRTEENFYHVFAQVKRVAERFPSDLHTLSIEYDAKYHKLYWLIGDEVVFIIHKIGMPSTIPEVVTILDEDGEDQIVIPPDFLFGFGCTTTLDGIDPNNPSQTEYGLVQVMGDEFATYVIPSEGFFDEDSLLENRLWGQGSGIVVGQLLVEKF